MVSLGGAWSTPQGGEGGKILRTETIQRCKSSGGKLNELIIRVVTILRWCRQSRDLLCVTTQSSGVQHDVWNGLRLVRRELRAASIVQDPEVFNMMSFRTHQGGIMMRVPVTRVGSLVLLLRRGKITCSLGVGYQPGPRSRLPSSLT